MAMIQARNLSSHTYQQKTADEVASGILGSFVSRFEAFQCRFADLEALEP
jgi:hypothetical protein